MDDQPVCDEMAKFAPLGSFLGGNTQAVQAHTSLDKASHSNVRSFLVKRAVVACTASVDNSVFRSVRGTRFPATIHSLTHHSSGTPDGAP